MPGGRAGADAALNAAIASPLCTPANKARDAAGHPFETRSFFGIRPETMVIELTPGGGLYTEMLAPYLKPRGQLILASDDPESSLAYVQRGAAGMEQKLKASLELCLRSQCRPQRQRQPPDRGVGATAQPCQKWRWTGHGLRPSARATALL